MNTNDQKFQKDNTCISSLFSILLYFRMANIFMNKFRDTCREARKKGTYISSSCVYSLWTQYSDDEMQMFDREGNHFLSFADVVPSSAMTFIWKSAKKLLGKDDDFLYGIDAQDYSPLHYAAMYSLDDVFKAIPLTDNQSYRKMCRHVQIQTRHSVPSLLIERDRADILELLVNSLHLSPFTSDFQDTYISWMHDAIFCNAKSVALYLYRKHRDSLRLSLLRRTVNQFEHVTLMDAVLLSEHKKDRHFYVDVILWHFDQGLRVNSIPFSHILLDDAIKEISTMYEVRERCLYDSILNSVGIQ